MHVCIAWQNTLVDTAQCTTEDEKCWGLLLLLLMLRWRGHKRCWGLLHEWDPQGMKVHPTQGVE